MPVRGSWGVKVYVMKSYLLGLWAVCLLCSCSQSSQEPEEVVITTPLYGFFAETETRAGEPEALEVLTSGNLYDLHLYPCCNEENKAYISEVAYYLNGAFLCKTNNYPFTYRYTAGEPGEYTLTVIPVFTSPLIKWEARPSSITIKGK